MNITQAESTGFSQCYQEFANVSTACGGLATGVYAVINNYFYINYTKPSTAMSDALWQVKYGGNAAPLIITNLTIPSSCWNTYSDKLSLRIYASTSPWSVSAQCKNSTGWQILNLTTSGVTGGDACTPGFDCPGDQGNIADLYDGDWNTFIFYDEVNGGWGGINGEPVYEEAMIWNISNSKTYTSYFPYVSKSLSTATSKHIVSNLTQIVNATLIVNTTGIVPLNLTYVSNTGTYRRNYSINDYDWNQAGKYITVNISGIEKNMSSNILTLNNDSSYPLISWGSNSDLGGSNLSINSIYLNVSAYEERMANITFKINNSKVQTFFNNTLYYNFTNLADGTYYANVTLCDYNNFCNITSTALINLDTNNPSALLNTPGNNEYKSGDVNFTVNISDNEGIASATLTVYTWNFFDITPITWSNSSTINFAVNTLSSTVGIVMSLTDNVYYWFYTILDWAGNSYETGGNRDGSQPIPDDYKLTIDSTKPLVSFGSGTENDGANKFQSNVYMNVTYLDNNFKNVTFRIYNSTGLKNATNYSTQVKTINVSNIYTGTYTYNVTVCDLADNCNSTETRTINLDTRPNVTITAPLNNSNQTTSTVQIFYSITAASGTTLDKCWYHKIGGSNLTISCSSSPATVAADEGSNTRIFYANNTLGELNRAMITFFTDSIKPLVQFVNPTDISGFSNRSNIVVNVTATDTNLMNITIYLYNSTRSLISNITTVTSPNYYNFTNLADGQYFFNASATDILNNKNSTETRNITIDTAQPQITYGNGMDVDYANKSQTFIFINASWIEANFANITFRANGNIQTFTNPVFNYTFTGLPNTQYIYNVTICDLANWCNATESRRITLDNTAPAAILTSPVNNTTNSSDSINFTATISDNLGIKNATLNIYNQSNLVNQTTISYAPNTLTATVGIVVTLIDNAYTWFYQLFDWAGNSYSTANNTAYKDSGNLSYCHLIDQSGNYYLNQTIVGTGDCFDIRANNVLFDCNSYSIKGPGGVTNYKAIFTNNFNNITIQNCNITGYAQAISFTNSSNDLIKNVESKFNTQGTLYGINLNSTNNVTLLNVSITNNSAQYFYGIYQSNANFTQIINSTVKDNSGSTTLKSYGSSGNNFNTQMFNTLINGVEETGYNFYARDSQLNSLTMTHSGSTVSRNNTILNVTSVITIGTTSDVVKQWYTDLSSADSSGNPLANCFFAIYDKQNNLVSSGSSNLGGNLSTRILNEMTVNETAVLYNTPHNITVSKAGYNTNSTLLNLSITGNSNLRVRLGLTDIIAPNVQIVYPTSGNFSNVYSINYTASDANLNTCWVSSNTNPFNSIAPQLASPGFADSNTPVAVADSFIMYSGSSIVSGESIIANDDPLLTSTYLDYNVTITVGPKNGSIISFDGYFGVFDYAAGITSGTDSFKYVLYNGRKYSNEVTVTITIQNAPSPISRNITLSNCNNFTNVNVITGWNNYTIYANDTNNNINSSSVSFFVDKNKPRAYLVSPSNNTLSNNVSRTFTYNVSDNLGVVNSTFYLYNQTNLVYNSTTTFGSTLSSTVQVLVGVTEGIYHWFISLFDVVGNNYITENNTLTIDTTPNGVTITSPTNSIYSAQPALTYSISGTDFATCAYSLNGAANQTIACDDGSYAINSIEGNNTLTLYATDLAGNTNSSTANWYYDSPNVTMCRNLYTANQVYTVQNNITATRHADIYQSCIALDGNNITLDLNGKTIGYPDYNSSATDMIINGFYNPSFNDTTVKNGYLVNGFSGVYFNHNVYRWHVYNMTFTNIGQPIKMSGTDMDLTYTGYYNHIIENNIFYNSQYAAIGTTQFFADTITNITIRNNQIFNCSYGIGISDSNHGTIILNNTIVGTRVQGIQFRFTDDYAGNNWIEGNTIRDGAVALYLTIGNNTFFNNNVYNNSQYSIYEYTNVGSPKNNYIYNNSFAQISYVINESVGGNYYYYNDLRLGSTINLTDNLVVVSGNRNSTQIPEYKATVSLFNIGNRGFVLPAILKNGKTCNDCTNFTSLTASTVIFNVSGFSNYSIGEDTQVPTVSINSPVNERVYGSGSISLNYSVSDNNLDSCWYNLNNTQNITLVNCANTSLSLGDGTYNLTLFVNDTQNHINSTSVIFYTSTGVPAITLDYPLENAIRNNQSVIFNFTATSGNTLDTCQLWGNWSGSFSLNQSVTGITSGLTKSFNQINIPEGSFKWNVYCNDTLGNFAWHPNNHSLIIDLTTPIANLISPSNNTYTNNQPLTFNYNVSDFNGVNNATLHVWNQTAEISSTFINLGGVLSSTISPVIGLVDGVYHWFVSLFDVAGNSAVTGNNTLTVDTIAPSIVINFPLNGSYYNYSPVINYSTNGNYCQYYKSDQINLKTGDNYFGAVFNESIRLNQTFNQNQTLFFNGTNYLTYAQLQSGGIGTVWYWGYNVDLDEYTWIMMSTLVCAYDPDIAQTICVGGPNFNTDTTYYMQSTQTLRIYYNNSGILQDTGVITDTSSTNFTMQITDRTIPLSIGDNLIGISSINHININNLNFYNGSNNKNFTQAATAGWISSVFYYWDPYYEVAPGEFGGLVALADMSDSLNSTKSYFLTAYTTVNMTFQNAGGSQVGDTFPLANVKFSNGTSELNISQAVTAGWTNGLVYGWDPNNCFGGSCWQLMDFDILPIFNSWNGYKINSTMNNIQMIFYNPVTCGENINNNFNLGWNTLTISTQDSVGNINSSSVTFFVDSIAPNATLNSPANNYQSNSSTVNFNYTVSDNLGLANSTLTITNSTGSNQTTVTQLGGSLTSTVVLPIGLIDGIYNWFVSVFDLVGNFFTSGTNSLLVDTTYPLVNITYPINGSYNSLPLSINYTVSDTNLGSCWYKNNTNGLNNLVCGNNITSLNLVQGWNNYTIYANDTVNHISSSSVRIFIDTIKPVLTINSPSNTTYTSNSLKLNVTSSETISSYWYTLNNDQTNTTFTNGQNITFGAGPNNLKVYANDSAGNVGNTSLTFSISYTDLLGINLYATTSPQVGTNFIMYANLTVDNTIIRECNFTLNSPTRNLISNAKGSATSNTFWVSPSIIVNESGNYDYTVRCVNEFGINKSETRTFTVDPYNLTILEPTSPFSFSAIEIKTEQMNTTFRLLDNVNTQINYTVNLQMENLSNFTYSIPASFILNDSDTPSNPYSFIFSIQALASTPEGRYSGNITLTNQVNGQQTIVFFSYGVNPPAARPVLYYVNRLTQCDGSNPTGVCSINLNIQQGSYPRSYPFYMTKIGDYPQASNCTIKYTGNLNQPWLTNMPSLFNLDDHIENHLLNISVETLASTTPGRYYGNILIHCNQTDGLGSSSDSTNSIWADITITAIPSGGNSGGAGTSGGNAPFVNVTNITQCFKGNGICEDGLNGRASCGENYQNAPTDCEGNLKPLTDCLGGLNSGECIILKGTAFIWILGFMGLIFLFLLFAEKKQKKTVNSYKPRFKLR